MSRAMKMARAGSQGGVGRRAMAQGDPGLFGGLIGAAKGFLTGGPGGAVAGAVSGFRGSPSAPARPGVSQGRLNFGGPVSVSVPIPKFGAPVAAPRGGAISVGTQIACPKGHRPNRSSYFLVDGTFVPEGSRCVKYRRRNPMNPRALSRAIGRLDSAKRLQHKLSGFSTEKYTATGKKRD